MARNKWFVSQPLLIVLKVAIALAVFMLANTVYLLLNSLADKWDWSFFAVGKTTMPVIFQVMILSHTGVGLLLVLLMLIFGIGHLPRVWKRYKQPGGISGISYLVLGLVLGITGLFILSASASRDNAWAWWLHVITAFIVPALYVLHRLQSLKNQPSRSGFRRFTLTTLSLVAGLAVVHLLTNRSVVLTPEAQLAREQGLHNGPGAPSRDVSMFREGPFVPRGFIPPESPFFPSAATTSSGGYLPSRIITRGDLGAAEKIEAEIDAIGFVKDTAIGAETCRRCHQDIVQQWETSAHRFASFNNPFYEATIVEMRESDTLMNVWVEKHLQQFPDFGPDGIGRAKSKWCSGCHDPSLMLAGKMNQVVDRRSPEAQAGLTCLACHAIDRVHDVTGNGNYNIADEQEDPYLFADSPSGTIGAFLHDAALKARPGVHMQQLQKGFFSTSEYCATCHKVSLDAPVNNYRWLRGQDEYDNWHDSGVSLNASRTFYLPPAKRVCQSCHMPPEAAPLGDVAAKNGVVRSHRFTAVNTALPFLRGDEETIKRIEDFLRNEKLRVDIFALSSGESPQKTMALNNNPRTLMAGEEVTVDVVVRNQGVGHTFPGGTNDSNEGWLEFSVQNELGNTLAISGYIDEAGHLDPMAHVFKAVMVDGHSRPIRKRNAQDIRATVFANVIGPGTADIAHYTFTVPEELAGEKVILSARLLWRKFDRAYTEFAFNRNPEGFKQFSEVPDLPVTEIDADRIILPVAGKASRPAARTEILPVASGNPDPNLWIRYNDYGIGLLLEQDTRGAYQAFEKVAELVPQRLDGPLNIAKTALQDGDLEKAYGYLRQCEDLKAGDPQVAWVWARVRQEDGLYKDAAKAYTYVLKFFPEDRAALSQLGRTYFLDQQYQASIDIFEQVLEVDPENRTAYYHLMLNYQALGMQQEADLAGMAFEYYRIDESAATIAQQFRLENPGANLMAQQIRIHQLEFDRPGGRARR